MNRWTNTLTATLMGLLTMLSLSSTAFAETTSNDEAEAPGGADVRVCKRCVVEGAGMKHTGFWISTEGLALLVAEVDARKKAGAVKDRALDVQGAAMDAVPEVVTPCPEPEPSKRKRPVRAAFIGLGAGLGVGALGTALLFAFVQ